MLSDTQNFISMKNKRNSMKKLILIGALFVGALWQSTLFASVDDGDPVVINVGYCVTPDLVDDALESAKSVLLKGDLGIRYHFHLVHTPDVGEDALSDWDYLTLYFENVKVYKHSFDAGAVVRDYTDRDVDLARVLKLYVPEIVNNAVRKKGIKGSLGKRHFKINNNYLRQKYRLLLLSPNARIRKPVRELWAKQMPGASGYVIGVSQTDCGERSLAKPDLVRKYKYLGYSEKDLGICEKAGPASSPGDVDGKKKHFHPGAYPEGLCIDYFDSQVMVLHLGKMKDARFSERAIQFVYENDCWEDDFDELAYNYVSSSAIEGECDVRPNYLFKPEDLQWNAYDLEDAVESASIVIEADVLELLNNAKAEGNLPEPFWQKFENEKKAKKSDFSFAEKGKYLAADTFSAVEEEPVVEETVVTPTGGSEETAPVVEPQEVAEAPSVQANEEESVVPVIEESNPVVEETVVTPTGGSEEPAPTPAPEPTPTPAPSGLSLLSNEVRYADLSAEGKANLKALVNQIATGQVSVDGLTDAQKSNLSRLLFEAPHGGLW
mgnify:CR=1 FL=1